MLFSSTNFGEQYFLFDDYYIPLYRYVKENFLHQRFSRMCPIAAPGKSISGKKLVTQIIVINLVRKIPTPVNIRFCICRLNRQLSVDGFYIGVIKCIDVHCHAQTVF